MPPKIGLNNNNNNNMNHNNKKKNRNNNNNMYIYVYSQTASLSSTRLHRLSKSVRSTPALQASSIHALDVRSPPNHTPSLTYVALFLFPFFFFLGGGGGGGRALHPTASVRKDSRYVATDACMTLVGQSSCYCAQAKFSKYGSLFHPFFLGAWGLTQPSSKPLRCFSLLHTLKPIISLVNSQPRRAAEASRALRRRPRPPNLASSSGGRVLLVLFWLCSLFLFVGCFCYFGGGG